MKAVLAIVLLALGCSRSISREPVVIGAKNGAESARLAELVAKKLESAGCRVERRFQMGDTRALDAAITSGAIDAYIESEQTALTEVLKMKPDAVVGVEHTVRPQYVNRGLFWSPPIGVGDQGVVFRRDIDQKCRAASRALMRVVYVADPEKITR